MLVLLEGVDGSGKTTLANELHKKNFKVVKSLDGQLPNQYELYKTIADSDEIVIFDRSFLSEVVYRMHDKKKPNITLKQVVSLLDNCKIIHCNTTTSYKDSMTRGEDNIIDEVVHNKIRKLYENLCILLTLFSNTKIFHYNYRIHKLNDVIKFIEEA